jgi:hypothetical protein
MPDSSRGPHDGSELDQALAGEEDSRGLASKPELPFAASRAHGEEAFHKLVEQARPVPDGDIAPLTMPSGRTEAANARRGLCPPLSGDDAYLARCLAPGLVAEPVAALSAPASTNGASKSSNGDRLE